MKFQKATQTINPHFAINPGTPTSTKRLIVQLVIKILPTPKATKPTTRHSDQSLLVSERNTHNLLINKLAVNPTQKLTLLEIITEAIPA